MSTQDWMAAAQARVDAAGAGHGAWLGGEGMEPNEADYALFAAAGEDLTKALAALRAVLAKCDAMEAEHQVGGFIAREFRGVIDQEVASFGYMGPIP